MHESLETIDNYLAACDSVRAAFAGMTHEQMIARPVPGKWSALEVLCHLVDTDLATATRVRATLMSDCPRLRASSREEMTTILALEARDAGEAMALFQTIRNQTARILRAVPGSLDRQALLVKAGGEEAARTVGQFISGITQHVTHHLAFVHEKRRALGLDDGTLTLAQH
jgi:hypothetical protein